MNDHSQIQELLARVHAGSDSATEQLLASSRDRLKRMISFHFDPRMSARIDPSDVVQEVLVVAAEKMPTYLIEESIPFHAWLRRIAWERLAKLHQQHLHTQKRGLHREQCTDWQFSDESTAMLANVLIGREPSPSSEAIQGEMKARVRIALDRLAPEAREFLIMRYVEQLSINDIATILETTVSAAKARHLRSLEKLRRSLETERGEL